MAEYWLLSAAGGLFEINLDRRKLKTPGGKLFTVPNEALAIAVATEWDAQKDTLKFYTMHLVRYFKFNETWICEIILGLFFLIHSSIFVFVDHSVQYSS